MIDFPNLQNISPISRTSTGMQLPQGKKEPNQTAIARTDAGDVVQISSDAAMKGKLSAFALTFAREMLTVSDDRIALLKAQYAGDACPVSAADIAGAILGRIAAEGSRDE